MKKYFIFLSAIFILTCSFTYSQNSDTCWNKFNYLIGEWAGEGSGSPGQGQGSFSFNYDLGKNIIVRKGHSEYPANNDKPAIIHNDLMVVYKDPSGKPSKAIYFDNEGHTINYNVVLSGNDIIFISPVDGSVPRFRLTYSKIDAKTVNIRFEIAPHGKPEEFKVYLDGKSGKNK